MEFIQELNEDIGGVGAGGISNRLAICPLLRSSIFFLASSKCQINLYLLLMTLVIRVWKMSLGKDDQNLWYSPIIKLLDTLLGNPNKRTIASFLHTVLCKWGIIALAV